MWESILREDFREYLIEYGILICTYFWSYRLYDSTEFLGIFLFLMALDGIYSTIAFLRLHSNNLTQSQVIEKIGVIYEIDLIDRYLYYLGISFIYQYIKIILWLPNLACHILQLICLITFSIPRMINYHSKTSLKPFFEYFQKMRIRISRTICAWLLARVMNFLSLICVDLRPNIKMSELYPLMKASTLSNTPKTILNFLIATLVQYTQNNGRTMSSRLIRVLYRYNTGKKIHSVKTEEQAKEKIVRVLVERKFYELIRPDTLQTIFYLYQAQEDGILYTFFTEFEYRVLQIGSIYTLIKGIFGMPAYMTAVFSLCLVLYRTWFSNAVEHRTISANTSSEDHALMRDEKDLERSRREKKEKLIALSIGRCVGFMLGWIFPENYLLVILVSELTYYLISQFDIRYFELVESLRFESLRRYLTLFSYETRYILIGLFVSNNWYRLLGAIILSPDLKTCIILLTQSLLLRLSDFNLLQYGLFIIQTCIYGYYLGEGQIPNFLGEFTNNIPRGLSKTFPPSNVIVKKTINLMDQMKESYYPLSQTQAQAHAQSQAQAQAQAQTQDLAKVLDQTSNAERDRKRIKEDHDNRREKEREEGKCRDKEKEKKLSEMSDAELKKKIEELSTPPGNDAIITEEASKMIVRSLRQACIKELDKSVYLDHDSYSQLKEEELSELYTEY